jgi:LDH2 family malate/lactate/ureidoglycolate dehydrogenase
MNSLDSGKVDRYEAAQLLAFAIALLNTAGLAAHRAREVAEILLEGDLLGHTTHGLALLPNYLKALSEDSMTKVGDPIFVADQGSAVTWDGSYLPGPWLVRQAIETARQRLAMHPVVTVIVRKSHHIGCLQAYLKPVTDAGLMILLSCSDPANRTVAPHGGTAPRFSPNPIAAGIPTDGDPILIDISTSTTANGLCKRKADTGERLPGDWLVDSNGQPTDDPRILFEGSGGAMLPLGGTDLGYKGFGFSLIFEALTNALGGYGRADEPERWTASVFLQLIDPARFGGRAAFLRETGFLAQSCRETPSPPGKPPVRLPGQAALRRRAHQLEQGVELYPSIMPALAEWAQRLDIMPPQPAVARNDSNGQRNI